MTRTRDLIRIAFFSVLFSLVFSTGRASDAGGVPDRLDKPPGEAEALLTVIRLLETDIATKSVVQDPDYAPGLVQIVQGDDLDARGVRTVGEALDLVAGLDVPIDNLGLRQPVIRGFGGILSGATGKLKVQLNGVSLNSTQSASGSAFYEIPIGQVERIEIIRGPGSAIYGEYAFLGVVNVITRSDGRHAFVRYDDWGTITAGGLYSYMTPGGVHFSINASGWDSDGPNITAGEDALYAIGQGALSNAPGPTNEARNDATVVLNLDYRKFSLAVQYLESGQGDYFGALFLPPDETRTVFYNRWWTVEGKQILNPTPVTEVRAKLGWQEFRNNFDNIQISPPGFLGIYPDGQTASTNYEEQRLYGSAEVVWYGMRNQVWLAGVEYAEIEGFNNYSDQNFDTNNTIPGTPFPAPLPESRRFPGDLEGQTRDIFSVFVQDQIQFNESLALTAGLRFDHYSDVGDALTPRLAVVYQIASHHIVKAQYAEAFRPPTFVELYSTAEAALGNPDIVPETVQTLEFGYIYKTVKTLARATLFHSEFENLIVSTGRQFDNAKGAMVSGLDLDLEHQISSKFKIEGNASYVDTEDNETRLPLEGSADLVANLGLVYQPSAGFSLNVRYRYISDRQRSPTDMRGQLESQSVTSVTASLFDMGYEGLTLRIGVENIFDQALVDPAPEGTYPDDFPREGRLFWAQVSAEL